MCYAKPGPRCTAHARTALAAAIVERDHMMEAIKTPEAKAMQGQMWKANTAWKIARHEATGEYPTRQEEGEWIATQPYEQQYGARAKDCHPALADAQDDYDATPGGIAEMKDRLAGLEAEHGDRVLAIPAYINTQVRLERAQQRRATQLEAYKTTQIALGKAVAPEPAQAEDEEAAAAPPPPCSCIEYRYQSDCVHLGARVEHARIHYLPTSHEASMALHAARSRRRGKFKTWETLRDRAGLADANATTILDACATNTELQQARWDADRAVREEQDAETAFFATPAGRAVARDRDARLIPVIGAGPHFSGTWDTVANNADRQRVSKAEQFAQITGQPGVVADDATPPDLMYGEGSRCSEGCSDFKWTAECAHTNEDWAKAAQLSAAFAQLPEVKAMRKAMTKAFEPKKPSLLSRLAGRR